MPRYALRRRMLAGFLLASVGFTARPALADPTKVSIDNFTFTPAEITVPAGTEVVWTNNDDIPHTVTDATDPARMKSHPLDTGDSFRFTFTKPGTYGYFCSLHPHMQGRVVVK